MNPMQRNSNFELLRVLVMFCVVATHIVYFNFDTEGLLGNFYSAFYGFGYSGLNCFFMMSGYFLGTKTTVSKKKILSLFVQILFCQLVALVVFLGFKWTGLYEGKIGGYPALTKMQFFGIFVEYYLLPITSDTYWYITVYILLLAILPLLNPFIQKLNKKGFILLLLVAGTLWFAFAEVRHYRYANFQRAVFFYCLGAFFAMHANQKSTKRLWISLILAIPSVVLSTILFKIFWNLPEDYSPYKDMIIHYVAYGILSPLSSILLFEFFKNLNFQCSAVNLISATTFSVYILHCQPFFGYLRSFWSSPKEDASDLQKLLNNIAMCLITFAICSLIDLLRLKVFNKQINGVSAKFLEFANSKLYRTK